MIRAAILALALLCPLATPAAGFRHRPMTVAAYYYPAPVSYFPVYQTFYVVAQTPVPVCFAAPPVVLPPRLYAVPSAAPPSGEPVMPRAPDRPSTREPPKISDSQSMAVREDTAYYRAENHSADRCRVGFWNVSGRDLVLRVDGRVRPLPRGRSVTLDLAREFVWAVEGSPAQQERVPVDKSTLEIVIRR